ncbi:hypothetical protein M407DRAFT_241556 [Tulasnella calospora MUT 4182]|uniref:ATPase inhibitor, mitochondrial n=1 Tax=Tulasnella calospora MUT 4182 TaxID=1051891 RepID=A0A0C3QUH9_9AGAM|nr:hypothetical protein M407DRAFT_241556 [Tulasnella calospora MUT 4182]
MFTATRLARRLPALRGIAKRSYSDGRVAGATANSREFSKKEKAHEDQYIRLHEKEQLEKLRKLIAKQEADLANLKQQVEEQGKKTNGGSGSQ